MIELKHVTKFYYGTRGVENVELSFPRGEIVGLFGENGAGKTTLMKCILGLHSYDGEITLDGERITRKNIEKLSFATCEHSFFPSLSPYMHMEFYKEHFPKFNEARFKSLMDFFELPNYRMPLRSFSSGQKNQFEVILALSQGADYILMDEPFAGNDLFNRADFYKVLLGILEPTETVLLSTHLIEEVSGFISRAVLLHKGKIVGDVSMEQLEETGENLVDVIKSMYQYQPDRVGKAIEQLSGNRQNR
ncbi:MAG: ABC transporter ATP-binding protein [Lachnospiraceae bacterium]|nr:ABC transporter ATP-binding protein [Lachnospiraceae bacterium]